MAVPRAVVLTSVRGAGPRIDQVSLVEQGVVDTCARGRGGVEVAGDDARQLRIQAAGQVPGQLSCGAPARGLTPVVQMRVEGVEHTGGAPDTEAHPGPHARRAGAFGFLPELVHRSDRVGALSEPEMIVFQRGEPARVVEDRHEFTVAASFAAGTDPRVTCAEVLLDVAQLLVEALLGADEVRGLAGQQLVHDRAALGPGMRGAGAGVAEIERHDVQRGRARVHAAIVLGTERSRTDRSGVALAADHGSY